MDFVSAADNLLILIILAAPTIWRADCPQGSVQARKLGKSQQASKSLRPLHLEDVMGWTDKLQAVAKSALTQNLMPALEAVREKVGPAALAAAKDDETLTEILKVGYLAIPMPLQLMVSRDKFILFCLANRDVLLTAPN